MTPLEESLLLGLRQEGEEPGADDARFDCQAGAIGDGDCFDLDDEPVQNSPEDEG